MRVRREVGVGVGLPARYSQIEGLIAPNQAVLDVSSGHSDCRTKKSEARGHQLRAKVTRFNMATAP